MAMSERKCCVKGCDSSEALSEDGVIFYSFPESSNEPERWNSWVSAVSKNIGDSSWQPETNTVICSKHFLGGIKSDIKSQVSYVPTTFPHSDNLKDLNVVNAYKRVRQHSRTDEDDPLSNSNVCQTQTNTLREEADVSPPKKSARHEIEDSHKISEKMKTVASQTIMPLLQDTFEFVSSFYGNDVSCQCNIGLDLFEKKDIPSGCVNTFSVVDELCASSECEGEESSSQIFIKTEPHLEMGFNATFQLQHGSHHQAPLRKTLQEDEEGDAWSDKSQYQDIESDEHDPLITSITHFSIECEPDIIEGEHNPSNKEKPEFIENESTPSIKTDPELTEDGFNCSIKIEPDNPIGYGPDIETPSFFESGADSRKRHFCPFCKNETSRFSRHIMYDHKDEIEVKEILNYPVKSKKRLDLIAVLRNRGNFLTAQKNKTPVASRMKPGQAQKYIGCPNCLKFVKRRCFSSHKKHCPDVIKDDSEGKSKIVFLNISPLASERLERDIFRGMRNDNIRQMAMNDQTIVIFGNYLCEKYTTPQYTHYIRTKIRQLTAVLKCSSEINSSISQLSDLFRPVYYDLLIETFMKIVSSEKMKTHSFVYSVGPSLKKCCFLLQKENHPLSEEGKLLNKWAKLFESNFYKDFEADATKNSEIGETDSS